MGGLQEKAVDSNTLALKATNTEYEIGTRSMLDVLIATQRLYQAKRLHASVKYRTLTEYIELLKLAGKLDEKAITRISNLLVTKM